MNVDSVTSARLLDGLPGVNQTLEQMAALVRRDAGDLLLREYAIRLTEDCEGHNFRCEIRKLFEHCRDNIIYRRDPVQVERVQDARRTLFTFGHGDCDDKVVCLASLLATLGHRTRFKVLGNSPGNYTHVYLEVHTRRGWVALDPTPETVPAGWEARGHAATYEIFHDSEPVRGGGVLCAVALAVLAYWLLK